MDNILLEKYSRLVVRSGINIQKNQVLVLTSPVECAPFARMIAENAYKEGAREVVLNWIDDELLRIKFLNAPDEIFDEMPEWQKEFYTSYARMGAGFVSILATDPDSMKGVDPGRLSRAYKTKMTELKEYRDRVSSNKNPWCVVSIPTKSWAKKVFPQRSEEEAVEKLWEAIFKTVRVDTEDPVAAWDEHKANLKKRMSFLNTTRFKTLHYKNSLGTDLKVELPEKHVWLGGSDLTPEGMEFIANMPTEEIFTLPEKTGVNGTIVSSMPLNHNGSFIDKFKITLKDGRIVDYNAEVGYETLQKIIDTDEGSHYLGEVALVPCDSPIYKSNILFLNTLFDENASCHFAIGNAYPVCIKGGENMGEEELAKHGANESLMHIDFMIGTEDLDILGITEDGREIQIFSKGNFAF